MAGLPISEEHPARPELVEGCAARSSTGSQVSGDALVTIDLRPTVRGAVGDLLAGGSAATVAGRFQATMAAAALEMVRVAEREVGRLPVVLTGGCFQNARLVEDVQTALASRRVYVHEQVPPNDGGIALGQAMVAGALLRDGGCARGTSRSV